MKKFLKKKIKQIKTAILKMSNVSDAEYVTRQTLYKTGEKINVENPVLFTEKLQWLKLNKYTEAYADFADKYAVRKYVEEKVGSEILNEIYGVYESADEIDIEKFPSSFVLKCTHGSGFNIIVKDKSKFDWPKAKAKLNKWMSQNYYDLNRERVYRTMKRRIICEKYLGKNGEPLIDYKFFCFHGEPKFVSVKMVEDGTDRRAFYTMDWKKVTADETTENYILGEAVKPERFDEMYEIAKKLCGKFAFIRIDLYFIEGRIYFGEITFFPTAGTRMVPHIKRLYKEWGDMIDLNRVGES